MSDAARPSADQRHPPAARAAGPARDAAFIVWMRHEIRTPVNALIGMANLLSETELTTLQRDYVTTLRESAERLGRLVDRLLDVARLAAGELVLDRQPLDLAEVVEAACDEVAPAAAARNLEFLCEIADTVPLTIVGDGARLRELLTALLEQAIQRTHLGGVYLALAAERGDSSPALVVTVADTGIGVSDDERTRLLRPIADLLGSGAHPGGRQDLAIALSRGLVVAMGGTFDIAPAGERGTIVRAQLPLILADDRRPERAVPQLAGRRLLVVSANPRERQLIARYARALGLATDEASTAAEALATLERGPCPEILLVDDRLAAPERDAVIAYLHRAAPTTRLVRLGAPAARSRTGPAADCLVRPVTPARLARVLTPREPPAASVAPPPALRILIGEDDPTSRKVLLAVLERLGYRADVAVNGREVLDRLARTSYDVLLLDMHMPEIDGETVVRRLKADWPRDRQPRIVAISATDAAEDRARWRAVGVDDWVSKTLPPSELPATLARVVGRHDPAAVPAALRALEASGAGDLAAQVARVFLEDATASLETLDAALARGDAPSVERAAHQLKGSAAMVGLEALVHATAAVMVAARRGALDEARAAFDALQTALAAVRPTLEQYAAGSQYDRDTTPRQT